MLQPAPPAGHAVSTAPADIRPALAPSDPELAALLLRPRSKAVFANGLRFAYTEWGNPAGPLVLCLHGFPVSPDTWSALGPALARAGYRVVAPAMRGYEPTAVPADGEYGAATLGRDVLGLMTALGADKAVLVGHDWGALAAFAAATLEPSRVTKLVAVAIPHPAATTPDAILKADHFLTFPWPGAATRFAADDAAGVDAIFRKWSPTWRPTEAERDAAKRAFRRHDGATAVFGYYRCLARDGLRTAMGAKPALKLGRLEPPTLMIYGDADGAVDARHFEHSRPFFTGPFRAVPIPGVGHFPQQEAPQRFAELVSAFMSERPESTSR
jgi:pimeloyl-ACP methyl ester carboxylesterase